MEPMIRDFSPYKVVGLTVCLFMFGLGSVIGNLVTGSIPEHKLTKISILRFYYYSSQLFYLLLLCITQF